jgi:hypothetical protein
MIGNGVPEKLFNVVFVTDDEHLNEKSRKVGISILASEFVSVIYSQRWFDGLRQQNFDIKNETGE